MKLRLSLLTLSLALFASYPALGQAPATAPAGSTGQCKDGSYTTAASKMGACRGHKGVQAWYAANTATPASPNAAPAAKGAPAPAPVAKPSPAVSKSTPGAPPAPAAQPAPKAPPKPAATAAPGGGPGQVWVNTSTKVYHCPGDRFYGKTKDGKYMSESDAKAMGARPERGKGCS